MRIQALRTNGGTVCSGAHLFALGTMTNPATSTIAKELAAKVQSIDGGTLLLIVGHGQRVVRALTTAAKRNTVAKARRTIIDCEYDYPVVAKRVARWSPTANLWLVRANGTVIK